MKNLANCKPSEFLKQTNLIKKSVEKWLTATDIMNIRKRTPELVIAKDTMTMEERREVVEKNNRLTHDQMMKNFSAIIDAIAEDHPEETIELLALVCFVEPEHADDHTMEEYLESISELLTNKSVLSFFGSLGQWVQTSISPVSKA